MHECYEAQLKTHNNRYCHLINMVILKNTYAITVNHTQASSNMDNSLYRLYIKNTYIS